MNEQKYCPKCGTPASPGAKFCGACGETFSASERAMKTQQNLQAPQSVDTGIQAIHFGSAKAYQQWLSSNSSRVEILDVQSKKQGWKPATGLLLSWRKEYAVTFRNRVK